MYVIAVLKPPKSPILPAALKQDDICNSALKILVIKDIFI